MGDATSGVTAFVIARALVFMAVLALAACGKTGPLYLPPAKPAAPPAVHHGAGPQS